LIYEKKIPSWLKGTGSGNYHSLSFLGRHFIGRITRYYLLFVVTEEDALHHVETGHDQFPLSCYYLPIASALEYIITVLTCWVWPPQIYLRAKSLCGLDFVEPSLDSCGLVHSCGVEQSWFSCLCCKTKPFMSEIRFLKLQKLQV
jgi:hypothetical protein